MFDEFEDFVTIFLFGVAVIVALNVWWAWPSLRSAAEAIGSLRLGKPAEWRPKMIWADRVAIFVYVLFVGGLWLLATRFSLEVFWLGLKIVVPLWLVLRGIDWVAQGRIR